MSPPTQLATAPPAVAAVSDAALVERARRGDREAEYALYRNHVTRVHRLIHRFCGDEELTNDLTQETFVRAFERLEHFRGEAAFGTWIHRIAVNLALNARRSAQRRDRWLVRGEADVPAPPAASLDPDLARSLTDAIGQLTAGQRAVFVMYALEGYTHVEIAQVLGISEGTSKGRLFHARARLQRLLARFAPEV